MARKHGHIMEVRNHQDWFWCFDCQENKLLSHEHFKGLHYVGAGQSLEVEGVQKVKSSKVSLRLDLVPEIFIRRVAQRFTEGAEKYGAYNYRKGINDPEFIQERINHLKNHLSQFLMEGNDKDDNLAAIGWAVAMLMEFEDHSLGKIAIHNALNCMTNAPSALSAEQQQAVRDEWAGANNGQR